MNDPTEMLWYCAGCRKIRDDAIAKRKAEYEALSPVFATENGKVVEKTGWRECRYCGTWNRPRDVVCANRCEQNYLMAGQGTGSNPYQWPNYDFQDKTVPFEEQIERWDRTATACPGSFARELRDYWIKKYVMPENAKRSDCNCDVCATVSTNLLRNKDFDLFTNEVPKGWELKKPQQGNPFYKDEK